MIGPLVLCLLEFSLVGSNFPTCLSSSKVISDVFCLPNNYRKEVPPTTDGPLNVFFKLPITEVSSVDDHDREITIILGYNMRWTEHRMVLNESADWSRGGINISPDMIQHFWIPDIAIHNLVRFSKPEILQEIASLEIVRDHSLYYKTRSDVTIMCGGMVFWLYPLDHHVCNFILSSYGYDLAKIRITGQYSYHRDTQRDIQFRSDIREIDLSRRVWHGEEKNYSMYGLEILLTRSLTPFIISVYIPSVLLVIISWLSFLLPPELPRIVLLLFISFILLDMFNTCRTSAPISNSLTVLDIWLLFCLFMIFLAIIQFLIITIFISSNNKNTHVQHLPSSETVTEENSKHVEVADATSSTFENENIAENSSQSGNGNNLDTLKSFDDLAKLVSTAKSPKSGKFTFPKSFVPFTKRIKTILGDLDKYSIFMFPVFFTSFNIIYWFYLSYVAKR